MAYDIFDSYKKRLTESYDTRFNDVSVHKTDSTSKKSTEEMFDEAFNSVYGIKNEFVTESLKEAMDVNVLQELVEKEFPAVYKKLGKASLEQYVEYFYDLLSPDRIESMCRLANIPVASFETTVENCYDSYVTESLEADRDALTEDFGSFPDWLKKFIQSNRVLKNALIKGGLDLAHAKFISGKLPQNARDPAFKDPHRISVFRMMDHPANGFQVIYIPGYTDPDVYPDPMSRWTRCKASALSKKKLLELTKEYGYIDMSDSSNSNVALRNQRYTNKRGSVDRDLDAAQHAVRTNVEYATDENGRKDWDNPISWDIKWVTKKGFDKSGYPLDPDKYGRMLDRVGLDDYAIRLEMLYSKIEAARTRLIAIMNKYTAADSMKVRVKSSWERNIFGDIQRIVADFSRAIDAYRELEDTVKELVSANDIDDTDKDRRIRNAFQWHGKRVREYLNEVMDGLKNAESAEPV